MPFPSDDQGAFDVKMPRKKRRPVKKKQAKPEIERKRRKMVVLEANGDVRVMYK